jgi:predicted glycosyltransferase
MSNLKPALLFYCQHSIGMGHLTRSFALAQALVQDFRVVFLNGGPFPPGLRPPTGVEIIDLPPLGMVDGHNLVSRDCRYDVEEAKCLRRDLLLKAINQTDPEVLLIELFPFGRKKFAFELLPLLKAARRRVRPPLVMSSVRDILVNARPDRQHHDDRARWISDRYFNTVLVHSDPLFARLEESFSPRVPLRVPVFHTGFVLPQRVQALAVERGRHVLVSAGGGMAGYPLFRAAIDAHDLLWGENAIPMRLVAGPFLPEENWHALLAMGESRPGLELIRSVPDLCLEMRRAAVSVSQCGYNTSMDILSSNVPAVVIPYAEGREDEQLNRAERLADLGTLRLLHPNRLNGPALADAIRECLSFKPNSCKLDLNGAQNTASFIRQLTITRDKRPRTDVLAITARAA